MRWTGSGGGERAEAELISIRPGFLDILDFCESNPRSPDDPGRVEWWAPSRFGRSLNDRMEPDILKFMTTFSRFEQSGWELHFLTLPRIGHGLAEVLNLAVYAYADAVYSKTLSENAGRGRRQEGEKGWWINGQAPWGTRRFDTRENRSLGPGENSTAGGGGTILQGDPEILPHWEPSARRFLAGASYKGIGELLYRDGLRGPQGGVLGHKHIRNFLTNRHLIGEVLTRKKKVSRSGGRQSGTPSSMPHSSKEYKRKSPAAKAIRETRSGPRREPSLVRPVCGHCGVEYHGGRISKKQGNERTYVHATPNEALHPKIYSDYTENRCLAWTVLADELEAGIKDLIMAERASVTYEAEVRALLMEKEQFQRGAEDAIAVAESRLVQAKERYNHQARILSKAAVRGLDEDPFLDELQRLQQQTTAARAKLDEAREYAASRDVAWTSSDACSTRPVTSVRPGTRLASRRGESCSILVGSRSNDPGSADPRDEACEPQVR